MKVHIARMPIGILAFDDSKKIVAKALYDRNPSKAAEEYQKGVGDDFLKSLPKCDAAEDDEGLRAARKIVRKLAISSGFARNDEEYTEFVKEFSMTLVRKKLAGIIKKDLVLVQSSNSLDSINKFVNILTEHFKEWFWLNYPEYKAGNDEMINALIEHGSRDKIPGFKSSYGIDFSKEDIKAIRDLAIQLRSLSSERDEIESYVRSLVKEVAPNFSCLIDGVLAARMIAAAGSLENASRMPASTLQLLGAEKALFRHLKNRRSKPPKFGFLYECSFVQNAPADRKGKVARIVASQLSKAAKIDYYSKRDDGEKLLGEMKKEIEAVMRG